MEDCCICLEPMNTSKNYAATKCGHKFCLVCLLQHFAIKNNCPLCREKLCDNVDVDAVMDDDDDFTPPPTPHNPWIPPPPPSHTIQRSDHQQLIIMNGELYFMEDDISVAIHRQQRPRRPRRCSRCHNTGHDRRSCPMRVPDLRI
jgi:hypothetical protein